MVGVLVTEERDDSRISRGVQERLRKHAMVRLRPDDSGQSPKEYHTPNESYRCTSHRPCRGNDVRCWTGPDCWSQAPATAPAPATAHAPVALQVVPAKIAVIEYEQATAATNEGQRALQALQKKYEPQKNQLQTLQIEIESLTKQLQSAPATMTDEERASRARTIETKQKQLQRDGEDATDAFNAELQETLGTVAKKLGPDRNQVRAGQWLHDAAR